MSIQIGAEPDSSFANPLGLLSDCHRRIEKFLQALLTITEQAGGSALNDDQQRALEVALRYFREAAPRHTRDEEDSLFPKMRVSNNADAQAALAALESLEADHDRADAGHAEVERLGRQWLADGHLLPEDARFLHQTLTDLQTLYVRHIEIEDTQVFPLAAQALDASTIQAVGREMAERRGIDLNKLTDLKLRCPTRR